MNILSFQGDLQMKTKDITLTAIMLTILIVCSQIALPIGPVPITLQTLAVLMIGYSLSSKQAVLATTLYLIMGLAGLPIFSAFSGGPQSILMPSFGFILGFIPSSYIHAKYLEKYSRLEIKHLIISGMLSFSITYIIGLTYMAAILNLYMNSGLALTGILMAGFIPFIPGDILKLFVRILLTKQILPIIRYKFSLIE